MKKPIFTFFIFIPLFLIGLPDIKAQENSTSINKGMFWTELQKLETLLVQTSRSQHSERASAIFADVSVPRTSLRFLLRMTSGLDKKSFNAEDYLFRYPFSSQELIHHEIEQLAELKLAEQNSDGTYRITTKGLDIVDHWMLEMGSIIESLKFSEADEEVLAEIIEMDHTILNSLIKSANPEEDKVMINRLSGHQPDYETPQTWHHWQLVWTMLAALKDEEIQYRKSQDISSVEWNVRRRIWFVHRKPWLEDVANMEVLKNGLIGYAPVDDVGAKIMDALDNLKEKGLVIEHSDTFTLTDEGLRIHDVAEGQILDNFLQRWPDLSTKVINEFYNKLKSLNNYLESLRA